MLRDTDRNTLAPSRGPILNDLRFLVPSMRGPMRRVLSRMRNRGYKPKIFETVRSGERAAWLTNKGTGILLSLHRLGLAVDVVEDDATPWNAKRGFWDALREEAVKEGLYHLRGDRPHLQAVTVSEQKRAWRLSCDPSELDAFASASMAGRKARA